MTIDAGDQTVPDEAAGSTNLKSELRDMLAKDFKKRLAASEHISDEQCERLCSLLADGSVSGPSIEGALTGNEEPVTDD